MLNGLLYRLRALFRRGTVEAELDEELQYHLDRELANRSQSGMPSGEAVRRARLAFGGLDQVREECRDARGTRWIEELLKDLRYGFRALYKSPVFALVTVLSLALGIGANTAIFSVVNAVLLQPFPYREPGRLAIIWDTLARTGQVHNVISPVDYLHWQEQSTVFEQIAAIDAAVSNLTGVPEPQEIHGQFVTPTLFPLLGVHPALGRTFTADEARANARVIVLSRHFWDWHFHSDPQVLGRSVEMDRRLFTIIGVMPEGFEFLDANAEYWLPFYIDPHKDYRPSGRFMRAVARLKPGVTLQQAQGQLSGIAERAEKSDPEFSRGWGVRIVGLREEVSGGYRRPLYLLMGAVCLVLLIACVNVANLLLSRAASRRKELAVRISMGASPWRIARQLLTESTLLAVLGGALGLLLAVWSAASLKTAAPNSLPGQATVGVDGRVLLFTALIAFSSALLFGMAPAFLGTRVAPGVALKEAARAGGSTSHSRRLPNALVMVEIALSVVLLAGSGLLIRSFAHLLNVNTGFRADHLLTARILLPPTYRPTARVVEFFREATHRIEALPGVRSASAVSFMPFGGLRPQTDFVIEKRPRPGAGEAPQTEVRSIRPNYFRTLGIPLLRGRDVTDHDGDPDRPVFIINHSLAAKYWPNEDPIGQRITVDMTSKPMPGEIVGIAADVKDTALDGHTNPSVFYAHPGLPIGYMSLVVRTSADPAALGTVIQQVVHSIDPNQPVVDIETMDRMLRRSVSTRHFEMILLVVFAAIALILAAVGIYGVVSYSVVQRTNEIGIRVALGASPASVLRLVATQAGMILLGGLVLGLSGALALTRTLSEFLFEVKPTDPLTFGAVTVLLAIVALAAILGPVRRASRVDPLVALRY